MTLEFIDWWKTEFGEAEIEGIASAIRQGNVSQGEITQHFEKKLGEYLGVPHVIATSSGTTALMLALMAIGISPGDEVIVPNRTWISTAHAPLCLGAKVILADVESKRPLISCEYLDGLISKKTKAIILVHLNGRAANVSETQRIVEGKGIAVIEDAAQAIGSRNGIGLLGTQSDVGCFSLSVAKTFGTGQGGFSITKDDEIAYRLRAMRTHGVENVKDPQKWLMPGLNFRFTDIAASIGLVQLGKLENRLERARRIYRWYANELSGCNGLNDIPIYMDQGEVPLYNEFLCDRRADLIQYLLDHNIDARPAYPDLHSASYLQQQHRQFPNSEKFGKQGLFLPSGPSQTDENISRVIETVKRFRA